MIVLDSTAEKLEIVLAGAVTTNQLQCYSAYRDITTTAYTPGSNEVLTNDTTDRNLVDSPAASTQRVIDYVSIFNADTATATVTVKYDSGGTERTIHKATLATGEKLEFCDGVGWRTFNASGTVKGIGDTGAAGTNGGGTVLGTGTSIIDFGSGAPMATLTVTGLTAILSGSLVYAWIKPEATTDHSAGEHLVEDIKVVAGDIVAGTGFTLYALCPSPLATPDLSPLSLLGRTSGTGQNPGKGQADRALNPIVPNRVALLTGKWSVGWFYTQ